MKDLDTLRKQIDEVDEAILSLIAKRLTLVTQVGSVKKEQNLPVIDKAREEEKNALLTQKGESLGVSAALISKIWKILYNEAYRKEK